MWKSDISGYFVSKCNLNFMGQPHLWLSMNKHFVMRVLRDNLNAILNSVGSTFLSDENETIFSTINIPTKTLTHLILMYRINLSGKLKFS